MEDQPIYEERQDYTAIRASMDVLKTEIKKVIVGQDKMIELLLVSLLAEGHVLIEGNPGLAKTLTAKVLARAIDASFSRIQFTPDLMPSDVLGTSIFSMKTSEFEFKQGPIFANMVLIDEINRSPAKTQAALFEVMEERQITIDGHRYPMGKPFMIMATQNPIEMEGTYRLPEAQMDRFLFKINVDYPSPTDELNILTRQHTREAYRNPQVEKVVTPVQLESFREKVDQVLIDAELLQFIIDIVQKTRQYRDIYLGASPRASLSLLHGSKALAMIRGRDFVIPEDILELAIPTLTHRVTILPEREMEGESSNSILSSLLKSIEVPR